MHMTRAGSSALPRVHVDTDGWTLLEDHVVDVEAVAVCFLVEGRNAWNSTWSRRYRGVAAAFPDVPSAKREAERRRKQGSVFTVSQRPALRFKGSTQDVLALHINTNRPFFSWCASDALDGAHRRLDLWEVASDLACNDYWQPEIHISDLLFYRIAGNLYLPALFRRRLLDHHSAAQGVDFLLAWWTSVNSIDRSAVYRARAAAHDRLKAQNVLSRPAPRAPDPRGTTELEFECR
jgi:hypothetical protein